MSSATAITDWCRRSSQIHLLLSDRISFDLLSVYRYHSLFLDNGKPTFSSSLLNRQSSTKLPECSNDLLPLPPTAGSRQQLPSAVVPIFSCRMTPVRFRFDQDILVRSASLSGPLSINIFRYHRHQRRRNTFTCSGINLTEKTFVTRPFIVNTLSLVQVTERLVCGRHRTMMDFATSFSSGAWQRPFNVSPI